MVVPVKPVRDRVCTGNGIPYALRGMHRTPVRSTWALAAVIVCMPASALAQERGQAKTVVAQDPDAPSPKLLELGGYYGAPDRLAGSISGVFLEADPTSVNGLSKKALIIRAAAGLGGVSAGIGCRAPLYFSFGPEALMTVTRTFSSARGSTGQSTYVGLEVGYVSVGRVGIGVARQVDGPPHRHDTILTWSVGVQIPYGFWRW